jgi:curli biogenesis system outer membrane secretion channel CsgG
MRRFANGLLAPLALLLLLGSCSYAINLGGLADVADKAASAAASSAKDKPVAKEAKPDDKLTISLPPWTGPKKRLGVMDVDIKVSSTTQVEPTSTGGVVSTTTQSFPVPVDFGTGLTEMLTTALFDSKRFILVERKAIADIQTEQALGTSGAASADSAAATGKLLGAQALIRGAVTEFTYKRSSTGGNVTALKGIGLGGSKSQAAVVLDVRIYDATTGVILDSIKAEGRANSSSTSVEVNRPELQMSASGFSQTPLGQATRQAITKAVIGICERMDKIPWEGRVAELDADASGNIIGLYLNAGSDTGMKVGDELEVLTAGRAIIDPDTKTVIGRTKDTRIGRCKIDTVMKSLCIASLTEGATAKIGDIVRFPATGLKAYDPGQASAPATTTTDATTASSAAAASAAQPADAGSTSTNSTPAPTN